MGETKMKKKVKPAELPNTILKDLEVVKDASQKEKKIATAKEAPDANFLLLKDTLYSLNEKSEEDGAIAAKQVIAIDWIKKVLAAFSVVSFGNRKHFKDIVTGMLKKEAGNFFFSPFGVMVTEKGKDTYRRL